VEEVAVGVAGVGVDVGAEQPVAADPLDLAEVRREVADVPEPVEGDWDPHAKDFNSLATWRVDEGRRTVSLRIPWSMLGFADPSSHLALGEGTPAERVTSDGIGFDLDADGATGRLDFVWPDWNNTGYRERHKTGLDVLADTYRDLAP
jgi:hypothetical protein